MKDIRVIDFMIPSPNFKMLLLNCEDILKFAERHMKNKPIKLIKSCTEVINILGTLQVLSVLRHKHKKYAKDNYLNIQY